MSKKLLCFLILNVLQILIEVECSTSTLDIHAVLITSEIIKPSTVCEENESYSFSKVNSTNKLIKLRNEMIAKNISAYIVLSTDEHQSEIVSDHDKRMTFISGFSGSNGVAVVTLNSAALWTDSRYYLQAEEEMDCNWIVMKTGESNTPTIEAWLSSELKEGDFVSSDPKISPYEKWLSWEKTLNKSNIKMKLLEDNLIDKIWDQNGDRPPNLNEPMFVLDLKFSGVKWEKKLDLIREDMKKDNLNVLVVTALDEIAWALNLRGSDIPFFPVFRSYLVVKETKEAVLYVSKDKITEEIIEHLNANFTRVGQSVKLKEYEEIWSDLLSIAENSTKIGLPSKYSYFNGINYLLYNSVPEEKRSLITSPILQRKDYKNEVEVEGMKSCHIRDGVAVAQFLAQIEEEVMSGSTNWTEMKAVKVLNELRAKQKYNAGISFGTIAAFGKNAASAHYQPTAKTDTLIDTNHLFMLDSGGQYYDGTTDVTRTIHFGYPREIEKEIYTRLLIGCIDVASVTFKEGYTLKQLEILIRAPLYEMGLDYGHGSTHGIGSFLAVHEAFNVTYHVNFFGSQEPGYYKENEFGMRLENIVTVVESSANVNRKNKYLTFDTVTMVPYERKLIKIDMLERKHVNWLNKYHEKVRKLVGAEMLRQGLHKEYQWLLRKTEPITFSHQYKTSLDVSYSYTKF